jgi:hypothetical protein
MTRALAVAAAVAGFLWFAVGVRQARNTDGASAIVTGAKLTVAQAAAARKDLDAAAFLNPDKTVEILRGEVLLGRGQAAAARAELLQVAREEPQNARAWVAFGRASRHDRRAFLLALSHIRKLVPPVPAPR